ncbi:MAG: LamG-like jellyroll fold domain-containing protein [bacterium]
MRKGLSVFRKDKNISSFREKFFFYFRRNEGMNLIEVILAGSIFVIGVTALVSMLLYGQEGTVSGGEQSRAVFLAEEGLEAIRNIRDEAWNEIEAGTGAVMVGGSEWVYVPGPGEVIDSFYTRTVTIEDVCRDSSNLIVDCPGSYTDLYTKKATVDVTWKKRGVDRDVERVTYLTNWASRDWVQTDWGGGPGQALWSDVTKYDTDLAIAESESAGQIQLTREVGVVSASWDFEVADDYTYTPADIEVAGGYAQLKGDFTEYTNTWPFDVAGNYTYDSGLMAVSGGSAVLINVPASSTTTWTFDTPGEYTYDPAKIGVSGGLASMKKTYDVNTKGIWHLNDAVGATEISDDSINANNLIINGNPTLGAGGKYGTGVLFDSNGDYGEIIDANQTGLDVTGPLTIDAWVKKAAYSGSDYIVRKWTSSNNRSYYLLVTNTGALQFYVRNGGTQGAITSSAGVVPVGTWVHVAAVYDGSFLRLFVNGIGVASAVPYSADIQDGTAPFNISYSGTSSFNGTIDDLRISSTARWTSNFTPPSQAYGEYATDKPTTLPTSSVTAPYVSQWTSFTETATKNGGEIYYQLSDDDGLTWKYWAGSSWSAAGVSDYNTATVINTNITSFSVSNKKIIWKAFFVSNGTQEVILDTVSIAYSNGTSGYATNSPPIYPTASFEQPELTEWVSFSETATKNGGEIYYQLSDDDGAIWQYWDGDSWAVAGNSDYDTATDVNANIREFSTTNKSILFKAFFESDGTQEVSLDGVTVGYYAAPDVYTQGLWHLDESSGSFIDDSGNGNHLTVNGNPTYAVAGNFDTAINFDSSGDYGSVDDSSQTGLDVTGALTIDAWVYRLANNSGDYIIRKWTSGNDRSYRLYTQTSGRFIFEVQNGGSNAVITSNSGVLNPNEWHHIAAVYDGSYLRLFVDGTSVATPISYSDGIQDGGAPLWLSSSGSGSFTGYIDEARVSNIARWISDFTPSAIPYSNVASYPLDGPSINPNNSFEAATVEEWNAFIEEAEKNGGEIYYQLSDDDGAIWQYWTGSSWTVAAGPVDYNTAEEVNINIADFSTSNSKIMFKAFLVGDGMQLVRLDTVRVAYTSQGGSYYGNQFLTTSINPSSSINNDNRKLSYRFTAQSSKTVDRVSIYQEASSGTSTFRVGIQVDDGSGNPSGTFLGSATYSGGNGWNTINISPDVDVTSGGTYHIVIERDSGSGSRQYRYSLPDNNITSYDNTDDVAMDVLWTANGGGSWIVQGWQPIYILQFTDGFSDGNPYYDSLQDDTTYTVIYGNQQFGENFTVTGGDKQVSALGFYVRKRSSGIPEDDLYATVYDMSLGEDIDSGVVVPAGAILQTFSWQSLHFAANLTLTDGHQYRISLSSPNTTITNGYDIYVMQTANSSIYYNTGYGETLARYCRSTTGGSSWTYYNYYDMAFRFIDYSAASSLYSELGYLISSALDMGDVSPVQAIEWDESIPTCIPQCEINVQVRTAPDSGGVPGSWTDWYGSAGAGSFFATSTGSIIPSAINGNRWVQYKATLIGDGADTPILEEMRINYR